MPGPPLLPPPSREFQVWYSVVVLDTAGYVIFFIIAGLSLRLLWRARASATTVGRRALLPYTAILLALGMTIFGVEMSAVSTALRLSATGYEFTGLVPGVPVATEIAINVLGQVAALMNDAFLLYRAYAIAIHKLKVVAIPILLWTASLILVILQNVVVLTIPLGVTPPAYTRHLTITWLGTVIALNVSLTTMIIFMLWPARRLTASASAIGIIAESEAAYTIVGVIYAAMMATGNPYGTLFLQLFGIAAFLSSSVITLRIASGIECRSRSANSDVTLLPTARGHWQSSVGDDTLKDNKTSDSHFVSKGTWTSNR